MLVREKHEKKNIAGRSGMSALKQLSVKLMLLSLLSSFGMTAQNCFS
jgi:hypothetical protein